MGYGGWSLYFDPKLIEDVVQIAASFPPELNTSERYRRIVRSFKTIKSSGQVGGLFFPPIS